MGELYMKIKEKFQKLFLEEFRFWEVIILMILTAFIGITLGGFIIKKNNGVNSNIISDSSLQEFINNYEYIVNNYYGEIDKDELLETALQAILEKIDDPYATYMDETESSNFDIQLSGKYQGLGVEIGNLLSDGSLIITRIFEDSPAESSGLEVGDILLKLNDNSLKGIASSDLSNQIRSMKEPFKLTVLRDKTEIEFEISLAEIVLKSVEYKLLENNIGYLAISLFADNTFKQTKSALNELQKLGMKSLIIDVRNNTGGYLSSVENILELFLDSSHVLYQLEDKNGIKKFYSQGKSSVDYPIVILTNGATASASEILTAALKEGLGALSVGIKTYGKGSAQKLHTLSDGKKYKFTTQKWLTPNGKSIDGNGIDVDYEIILSDDYYKEPTQKNDNQLQTAISLLYK